MKILIVIDSVGTGGAQKLKAELAIGLAKHGYDVEMFVYNQMTDEFFASRISQVGIKINIASKINSGFSLNVLRELRGLVSQDFDIIISSMHAPSIYSALALFGKKKSKFIICEESSSMAPISFFRRLLFYLSTLFADYLVPNSFNEAKLIKKIPGRSNKVHSIWNGYDLSLTPFYFNENHNYRGINKLLVVGRIAYPKNGMSLLKAISLFYERNGWIPEIHWVGRSDNDSRSKKMKDEMDIFLSMHPKIKKKWHWRGTVDDVREYYNSCDALIHVSIYEGLPNVICEAMLTGCFVIASNVCDHPLLIGDNQRGLLCDPDSPQSICDAIESLNNMDGRLKKDIIKNAREFSEIEFNRDNMIKKYVSLINEKQ